MMSKLFILANPSLTPDNLLHAIGFEMDLDVEPDDPQLKAMHKIQDYLVRTACEWQTGCHVCRRSSEHAHRHAGRDAIVK